MKKGKYDYIISLINKKIAASKLAKDNLISSILIILIMYYSLYLN